MWHLLFWDTYLQPEWEKPQLEYEKINRKHTSVEAWTIQVQA